MIQAKNLSTKISGTIKKLQLGVRSGVTIFGLLEIVFVALGMVELAGIISIAVMIMVIPS